MTLLVAGNRAPNFELCNDDMHMMSLSDFVGKKTIVLYFYPKDDTPGCTTEAIEFTTFQEAFDKANTVVLGVSRDDCVSHAAFKDKHGLTVTLLADTEGEAGQAYGVWQEKEKDGIKKMGIVRSTFLIDRLGIIRHALYNVHAKGHAEEVLALVQAMH